MQSENHALKIRKSASEQSRVDRRRAPRPPSNQVGDGRRRREAGQGRRERSAYGRRRRGMELERSGARAGVAKGYGGGAAPQDARGNGPARRKRGNRSGSERARGATRASRSRSDSPGLCHGTCRHFLSSHHLRNDGVEGPAQHVRTIGVCVEQRQSASVAGDTGHGHFFRLVCPRLVVRRVPVNLTPVLR